MPSNVSGRLIAVGLGLASSVCLAACRGTPSEAPAPAELAEPHSAPESVPAAAPPATVSAPTPTDVSLTPAPSASAAAPAPPLVGPDGTPLPQTEDKPSISSGAFRARIELVASAILSGDPAPAHAAFFPLVAYRQVKAIKDPDRDYERRLVAAFDRDVAEYHRALGKNGTSATFAGIDVPEPRVEWMKPGREGNKVGYYRVLRSKLRFALPDGKERALELTSMISWRGEWYVVHLSGFD
jgi:hypothetical protein